MPTASEPRAKATQELEIIFISAYINARMRFYWQLSIVSALLHSFPVIMLHIWGGIHILGHVSCAWGLIDWLPSGLHWIQRELGWALIGAWAVIARTQLTIPQQWGKSSLICRFHVSFACCSLNPSESQAQILEHSRWSRHPRHL